MANNDKRKYSFHNDTDASQIYVLFNIILNKDSFQCGIPANSCIQDLRSRLSQKCSSYNYDIPSIILVYNSTILEESKTLQYYNISDPNNLYTIQAFQRGNYTTQVSKIDTNSPSESSIMLISGYNFKEDINCLRRMIYWCSDCCCLMDIICSCCECFMDSIMGCWYAYAECMARCCVFIMTLIFFGICVMSIIGLNWQRFKYEEYSSSPLDINRLNSICNNQTSQFIRYTSRNTYVDPAHEFGTASLWIVILLAVGCVYGFVHILCIRCKECRILNCGVTIGFMVATGFLITININITFDIIQKIKEYCDKNTDFYNVIINQWSLWNYIFTYASFSLIPLLGCLCCMDFFVRHDDDYYDNYYTTGNYMFLMDS